MKEGLSKKNIILALVMALLLPVMAARAASFTPPEEPAEEPATIHFYAGGQLGANVLQAKINATTRATPTLNFGNNYHGGIEGFEGGIFTGIAWHDDKFYVALELHGDGSTNSQEFQFQTTNTPINFTLENKYNAGVSFVPGIYLNENTMVYIRAAAVFAKFKQTTNGDGGVWVSPNTFSTTKLGWRGGLGLQADIDEDISIRLEYDYTRYGSFTAGGTSAAFGNDIVDVKYKPRSHTALIALAYRYKSI